MSTYDDPSTSAYYSMHIARCRASENADPRDCHPSVLAEARRRGIMNWIAETRPRDLADLNACMERHSSHEVAQRKLCRPILIKLTELAEPEFDLDIAVHTRTLMSLSQNRHTSTDRVSSFSSAGHSSVSTPAVSDTSGIVPIQASRQSPFWSTMLGQVWKDAALHMKEMTRSPPELLVPPTHPTKHPHSSDNVQATRNSMLSKCDALAEAARACPFDPTISPRECQALADHAVVCRAGAVCPNLQPRLLRCLLNVSGPTEHRPKKETIDDDGVLPSIAVKDPTNPAGAFGFANPNDFEAQKVLSGLGGFDSKNILPLYQCAANVPDFKQCSSAEAWRKNLKGNG